MREGDIYFWRYSDDAEKTTSYGMYHCKSQIAVVRNGKLIDTFWGDNGTSSVLDPNSVVLDFRANREDLVVIHPHTAAYYDRADIVDTRHSNKRNAPVYRFKTAKRSRAAMLEQLQSLIREKEMAVEIAQGRLKALREAEQKVMLPETDLDEVYF